MKYGWRARKIHRQPWIKKLRLVLAGHIGRARDFAAVRRGSLAGLAVIVALTSIPLAALFASYNAQQARIPKPLAADAPAQSAPADDTVADTSKASALPADLQATLDAEREAAKTGVKPDRRHVQTLDEGRTATDTVYKNADGTKTLERAMQAVNYQENGQWKKVDNTLEQDSATGTWKNKANSWSVKFDKTSKGITLSKAGEDHSFKPVNGADVAPSVTGTAPNQIVTYRNVWQGIDLVYQVSGSELKESIVVKSKIASTTYAFDVSGSPLVADTAKPGFYKLSGALSGITLGAPTVATFDMGVIGGAPLVTSSLAGSKYTLNLDSKWLSQQATTRLPGCHRPALPCLRKLLRQPQVRRLYLLPRPGLWQLHR
jgi:hypothetical protein